MNNDTHFLMKNDEPPHLPVCGHDERPRKMTNRVDATTCPQCLDVISNLRTTKNFTAAKKYVHPGTAGTKAAEFKALKKQHNLVPLSQE